MLYHYAKKNSLTIFNIIKVFFLIGFWLQNIIALITSVFFSLYLILYFQTVNILEN